MLPQSSKIALVATLSALLGACSGVPYNTSELVPPAKRCMVSPSRLQNLKEGDDLVQAYASAVRSYGRETSKTRCLQKWTRTVLAK